MVPIVIVTVTVLALGINPAGAGDVTYYDVTRGAHPHDVAPAPDGKVWYTAQSQGALGILDPKTGRVSQVSLGKDAAPHGVIVGPDRAAWITEGGQNAIARFDPTTKAVKLFPLPKEFPNANLNTATFDRKGILWFTGQNGVYGRVDPASGKVEAWKAPKGVGPYGITTTPNGEVWYASLAGDHIVKIDTVSGDALMVPPPKPGVGPRRIWSDSKGLLWVSFWTTGEVGLLCGLCRRQEQGLAHRFHRQRNSPLRSDNREVRELPERSAWRFGAPVARPAWRVMGRGIRHRPAGGSAGLSGRMAHAARFESQPPTCPANAGRRRGNWRILGGRQRAKPCGHRSHWQSDR